MRQGRDFVAPASSGCFPAGITGVFEGPDDVVRVGLREHHVPSDPVPHLAGVALMLVDP